MCNPVFSDKADLALDHLPETNWQTPYDTAVHKSMDEYCVCGYLDVCALPMHRHKVSSSRLI